MGSTLATTLVYGFAATDHPDHPGEPQELPWGDADPETWWAETNGFTPTVPDPYTHPTPHTHQAQKDTWLDQLHDWLDNNPIPVTATWAAVHDMASGVVLGINAPGCQIDFYDPGPHKLPALDPPPLSDQTHPAFGFITEHEIKTSSPRPAWFLVCSYG
jgi:hypothetical protein